MWPALIPRNWTTKPACGITLIHMPVITFKVTAPEARVIRAKARTLRTSVSAYLRHAALGRDAGRRRARIVHRRHPVSGLTYNAAAGRTVTQDEIRAALADFP